MTTNQIAILGTVGVPGNYGGFETLADNLVRYHDAMGRLEGLTVYCSAKAFPDKSDTYGAAHLRYLRLDANGAQSILYDSISLFDAARRGNDRLLLLGVSGGLALPFLRLVSRAQVVTNIDGIEWKRQKWKGLAKTVLRISEWAAVRFSHSVIADNQAIADYVSETYGISCEVIPYGGDHALEAKPDMGSVSHLPEAYALALCRIEPENNVAMILEAFAALSTPLLFVGNWENSKYGLDLKARYQDHPNINIHDPVYASQSLRAIRNRATIYIHGHSAGGTNPALVEMMHFGVPILAFDCVFNRYTTEDKATYFADSKSLIQTLKNVKQNELLTSGEDTLKIAKDRYTWKKIGKKYFDLLVDNS